MRTSLSLGVGSGPTPLCWWLTTGSTLIDVGGGNAKDSKRHALSNIPLRWMMREILNSGCHIHFDPTALKLWDIPLGVIERPSMVREASSATYCTDTLRENAMVDGDEYRDAPGKEKVGFASYGKSVAGGLSLAAEESLDGGDAVKKLRDELKKQVFWWILEVFPTYYKSQDEQGHWIGKWR